MQWVIIYLCDVKNPLKVINHAIIAIFLSNLVRKE